MGAGIFSQAWKWVKKDGINLAKNAWKHRGKIIDTVNNVAAIAKLKEEVVFSIQMFLVETHK
jgi:hypothetical protein